MVLGIRNSGNKPTSIWDSYNAIPIVQVIEGCRQNIYTLKILKSWYTYVVSCKHNKFYTIYYYAYPLDFVFLKNITQIRKVLSDISLLALEHEQNVV